MGLGQENYFSQFWGKEDVSAVGFWLELYF
jgi:hypothetical protein